ncbi:exopolyphosphatase [Rivularia sp. PCC 7116]|uniref:Ppx/GppA phosphatase family protein n=1 Tax=Rivularia sp. PCC 7116 TaxID=373994 RepID=UPI00029EFF91|nr:Ppx/GppA phosphatase family protein [Rivularia sp. PCC 7116]AFY58155.1 exopolyphosphatase [Rivularia sp. PCC 7116]
MVNSTMITAENVPIPNFEPERIVAAIDLGTNSVHMVIVRIEPSLPSFSIVGTEKETVRLGDRDVETGNLKPKIMERTIIALERFQEIARTLNAQAIIAVATSAVREAPNGRDFLYRINQELNLDVDLISGQEEARRIYLGVLSGMEFNNEPHTIIDIGGGSTELILGDSHEERCLNSTKVGAVRLTSELITTDPISDREFNYLKAYARGMLERAVEEVLSNVNFGETIRLVGTSGTIETLANIHAKQVSDSTPSTLNGYSFSLKDLQEMVSNLRKMTNSERAEIPGMSEKRSEVILAGAVILQEAMTLLGVDSITTCERALREGLIVNWMLAHDFIDNRLRFQSTIRQRSVFKIAKKYKVDLRYSERIATLALSLFDQTKGYLHEWGNQERFLLWAASELHNCGHYISHSSHHKHSYYLIRNSGLLGYNETEIEIIANLARYHRKSQPKKKHDNYQNLATKYQRLIVEQLSPMLRLATSLDRRQIGAISKIECDYSKDNKELHLKLFPSNKDDDCAIELWSFSYSKLVFEEQFGVKLVASLETD